MVRPVAAVAVNQFPPKNNNGSKPNQPGRSYQLDEGCCSPWTSGRNEVTLCQGSLNCFRPKNRRCVLRGLAGAEEVWLTYQLWLSNLFLLLQIVVDLMSKIKCILIKFKCCAFSFYCIFCNYIYMFALQMK